VQNDVELRRWTAGSSGGRWVRETVEYLVFVRFENSPAEARRHVEQAEMAGSGKYVLESRYYARPGEETPWLEQALADVRGTGQFVALYRGRPVGEDFAGNALFHPLDLVWCKDDVELAQMLGILLPDMREHEDASLTKATVDPPARRNRRRAQRDLRFERDLRDDGDPRVDSEATLVRGEPARKDRGSRRRTALWFLVCLAGAFVVAYLGARLIGG
jgi:hypothetical protein